MKMNYHDQLRNAIREWKKDPIVDEWVFDRFRRDCIGAMSPEAAYDAIGDTVAILVNETDPSTVTELVQSLIALAMQSATTQIPESLLESRSAVESLATKAGEYTELKLRELYQHYRLG